MKRWQPWFCWVIGLVLATNAGTAWAHECCIPIFEGGELSPVNEVTHTFLDTHDPSKGTAWRVRWAESPASRGLTITGAWFRPSLTGPEIQVIGEVFLAQIYVPYHRGHPRIRDLTQWGRLNRMWPEEGGHCGVLGPKVLHPDVDPGSLYAQKEFREVVMQEIRHYGLSYTKKDKGDAAPPVFRRGQKLVLWGTYDADNYEYVMEYGFRDDGTVELRLGSTGFNNPGFPYEGHMHTAFWHINLDINGPDNDRVYVAQHLEPWGSPAEAADFEASFKKNKEGAIEWNPLWFTSLIVKDQHKKNSHGNQVSWEILSMRPGLARHYDAPDGVTHYDDSITHHDFWVTRWKAHERWYAWVDKYAADKQAIDWEDIVIWATSASHHRPRDEDFGVGSTAAERAENGAAWLMWSGFNIRPRNVFDTTPFVP